MARSEEKAATPLPRIAKIRSAKPSNISLPTPLPLIAKIKSSCGPRLIRKIALLSNIPCQQDQEGGLSLHLTFDQSRPDGFVFGYDETCDIRLPRDEEEEEISPRHFAIKFDEKRRLVVCDMSPQGTMLCYSRKQTTEEAGHHVPKRKINVFHCTYFTWIVAGDPIPNEYDIAVRIRDTVIDLSIEPSEDVKERKDQPHVAWLIDKFNGPDTAEQAVVGPEQRPVVLTTMIGSGGFGSVTRCWDATTGEIWAEKKLKPYAVGDKALKARKVWENEINLLKGLEHENIIKFFGSSLEPPVIKMELARYGDLSKVFPNDKMDPPDLYEVARQTLSGLKYLHGHKNDEGKLRPIVHRDVKPGNILVAEKSPRLLVKLADFGLANAADNSGFVLSSLLGAPQYHAPDLWDVNYGPKVDIWSLGVTLLQYSKKGVPEFFDKGKEDREGRTAWHKRIARHASPPLGGLPSNDPFTVNFVGKYMLKLDPKERATAEDCLVRLQPFLDSLETMHEGSDLSGETEVPDLTDECDTSSESGLPASPWQPPVTSDMAVFSLLKVVRKLGFAVSDAW